VEPGQRVASYDISLVVSGGVDCRRRRRNVYDKKPQRYAKDNRKTHLTARSDKSVAYVTNNKKTTRRFVLLKLTTDRHEASRGSIATAELLVISALPFLSLPLSLHLCVRAGSSKFWKTKCTIFCVQNRQLNDK